MRILAELIGGVALLAIFAYGVAQIIKIIKHMEKRNGENKSTVGSTDKPSGDDGGGQSD